MKVVVYTANIGRRDAVFAQTAQDAIDTDWLYLTDDADLDVPEPWAVRIVEREHDHPNMAAKVWRTHPARVLDGYAAAIWIDANMQVTRPYFVFRALQSLRDGFATWTHPRRDCVYDEIEASLGAEGQDGRYAALPLREQGDAYRAEGYPEHNGLYATGTLIWTPQQCLFDLADDWYRECEKWGYQDQVSFPVVCWRHGIRPGTFPVVQTGSGRFNRRQGWFMNEWMLLHNHEPGTG